MAVTVLNKDNFKNEVLKADKPVLVDSGDKSLQGGH